MQTLADLHEELLSDHLEANWYSICCDVPVYDFDGTEGRCSKCHDMADCWEVENEKV